MTFTEDYAPKISTVNLTSDQRPCTMHQLVTLWEKEQGCFSRKLFVVIMFICEDKFLFEEVEGSNFLSQMSKFDTYKIIFLNY